MPTSFRSGHLVRGAQPGIHLGGAVLALAGVLTIAFAAGHVGSMPGTRDGIDSANFVLAVDDYDPSAHQPHPPGFPLHVALGRVVTSVYRAMAPTATGHDVAVARSLRLWSVAAGALAVFALLWVAAGLGTSPARAALVAALAATCPLFWITAMRPLSDVPGLLFALMSQALALSAHSRSTQRERAAALSATETVVRQFDIRLAGAAVIAGLAVGVRLQTALLTVPVLFLVAVLRARRERHLGVMMHAFSAFVLGLAVWGIPMLATVGGPSEYLRLLTTVAVDDVQGVEMVATHPGPRLLALALVRTFIVPWGPAMLGYLAFGLSVLGGLTLLKRNWRACAFAAVMGLPYLVFHLMFQESASIRYALPLVPISCFLIGACLEGRFARFGVVMVAVLMVSASAVSVGAATAYSRTESPVARALEDLRYDLTRREDRPTLAFHHAVGRAIRGEDLPVRALAAPVRYEWLEMARHWLEGGREPVSFLADVRRTDLALIDPMSRTLLRTYRWPQSTESLLGGIQPSGVSWYQITAPGWFVMRGWSLTPETNGVARRDGRSPGTTGIFGHIKRREAGAVLMIGGRNLGGPCDTGATVEMSIDGKSRAVWVAPPQSSFLHVVTLAPGELRGDGDYAALKVLARDAGGTARVVDVAIEHFDVQSPGAALLGFDQGWHMPELDPSTGVGWRWMEPAAELRTEAFGRDAELVIRGESPLKYFQTPPRVTVTAGGVPLASFRPDSDFEWVVRVPAAALASADGRIAIESDRWFIQDEVNGNGDRRRLALRIYSTEIRLAK
jgi:hypothetical protein